MAVAGSLAKANAAALYDEITNGTALTSSTLAAGDYLGVADVSDASGKKITIQNLATFLKANYGLNNIIISSGAISISSANSYVYTETISSDTKVLYLFNPNETAGFRCRHILTTFANGKILSFSFNTEDGYGINTANWAWHLYFYNGSTLLESVTLQGSSGNAYQCVRNSLTNCTKVVLERPNTNSGAAMVRTTITPTQLRVERISSSYNFYQEYYKTIIK